MESNILPRNKRLIERARNMRNNATKQENHLWYDFLKNQKHQFYRQRIVGAYIVDFYCPTLKLVIEVDGMHHYENEALEYDKQRTEFLESLGLVVLRLNNFDIDHNFKYVCQMITQTILSRLAATAPLPKEP